MAGLSFTTSGATPLAGSTLANAQRLGLGSGLSFNGGGQVNSPAQTALGKAAGAIPSTNQAPPAPTTPVKKTTVNNVDGSSTSTEYHAPDQTTSGLLPSNPTTIPVPTYGSTVTDAQGNQGIAKFDPNTGQPLQAQNSTPQTSTPPVGTFPGIVGSLVSTSQNGSQNATQATTGLLQSPNQNDQISQEAKDIGTTYGQNIAKISNYGNALAGSYTNGAGLAPVSQGLAGQAEQTTAAEVQGQESAENAALAPLNQELAAQGQAQSGLASAGGIANTQQQNQQSGLTSAGTLAQPSATSQGQTVFDPTTGKFTGGSYQDNLATVVQSIKNGNMGYTAGVDSLAGLSPTAKADVLAALGPGFDTVSSDAQAATKGSNIQTGGTATTGANATGLTNSIQQETSLNTAATNASALGSQVSEALKNSGLDMTNSTDANTAINNLQSRLGNAGYTQLNIAVNDARNAYGAILQATGATPTDAGQAANQNINANMSPKQILAAIDQLTKGVTARQASQHAQTEQYQTQLNSSGAGSSGGTITTAYGAINPNL